MCSSQAQRTLNCQEEKHRKCSKQRENSRKTNNRKILHLRNQSNRNTVNVLTATTLLLSIAESSLCRFNCNSCCLGALISRKCDKVLIVWSNSVFIDRVITTVQLVSYTNLVTHFREPSTFMCANDLKCVCVCDKKTPFFRFFLLTLALSVWNVKLSTH